MLYDRLGAGASSLPIEVFSNPGMSLKRLVRGGELKGLKG